MRSIKRLKTLVACLYLATILGTAEHASAQSYWRYGTPERTQFYPYWNPVRSANSYGGGYVAPDGSLHTDRTVEKRHWSYYNPGRNYAITRPETSIQSDAGLDYSWDREHTRWIGADGQPHGTIIDRTTYYDPWGNTHTESEVRAYSNRTAK